MEKNIINELFGGISAEEMNELFDKTRNVIEKLLEDDENDKTEEHSYVSESGHHYDNGKLVEKYEKEYINGKCVKDEVYTNLNKSEEKPLLNKKTERKECVSCSNEHRDNQYKREISALKKENKNYFNQISEMTTYIDDLNGKIKELTVENNKMCSKYDEIVKKYNSLINKIDKIKSCF